jgi:hypothetical protein
MDFHAALATERRLAGTALSGIVGVSSVLFWTTDELSGDKQ